MEAHPFPLCPGDRLKPPSPPRAVYGKSLGTAPSVDLATTAKCMGVILVSPLASGARVVFPNVKNSLLDKVFCPSVAKIGRIKAPINIIHGTNDEVIHMSNGKSLYEACKVNHPLPPVWVDGAGHNDIESRSNPPPSCPSPSLSGVYACYMPAICVHVFCFRGLDGPHILRVFPAFLWRQVPHYVPQGGHNVPGPLRGAEVAEAAELSGGTPSSGGKGDVKVACFVDSEEGLENCGNGIRGR